MSDSGSTSSDQPVSPVATGRFTYLPSRRWFLGSLIVTAVLNLVLLFFSGLNDPLGQLVILPLITLAFFNWYGIVRLWVNRKWPRN